MASAAVLLQAVYGNVHVRDGPARRPPGDRRRPGRARGCSSASPAPRSGCMFAVLLASDRGAPRGARLVIAGAILIGVAAGLLSGLLGIGGGALFVPALVLLLGLGQVEAEATSLLAIVPVAAVGAWRQHRYGNVRVREGLLIGLIAIPGALARRGARERRCPERATEYAFAALLLWIAWTLARGALGELRAERDARAYAVGMPVTEPGAPRRAAASVARGRGRRRRGGCSRRRSSCRCATSRRTSRSASSTSWPSSASRRASASGPPSGRRCWAPRPTTGS